MGEDCCANGCGCECECTEGEGWLLPREQSFWMREGCLLRSLRELAVALACMSEETFSGYVSDQKNDFAMWVQYAFGEEGLANRLREEKSQSQMRQALQEFLAE